MATDAAERLAFLRLLRQGVRAKVADQQRKLRADATSGYSSSRTCSSSSEDLDEEAAELREGGAFPAARGGVAAWEALAWRDAFSTEPFFESAVAGRALKVKQVMQGELNGFGTGLTVWPAACVLLKHLDHRAERNASDAWLRKKGAFVIELGSGTGAVGIAAAMLVQPPARVVISDVDKIQFIMRENAERAGAALDKSVDIDVLAYEWGSEPSEQLLPLANNPQGNNSQNERTYPDLILVSDCILPRLYPIEPLVDALNMLSGANTHVLISFEHRYYQHFDPKARFWELMAARGFELRELDEDEYHPHYRAGDIEIWEIKRVTK